MDTDLKKEAVVLPLSGRIDSGNAPAVEQDLLAGLAGKGDVAVELNAQKLEYISSAGLRVVLRLRKKYSDFKITNVNPDVYDILEMTGFTEMMDVVKAYRVVSVEGCEVIGEGFNGKVYRIDKDNVVKTYKNADALSEIQHEREVARLALILGVPTAISYDVVRVGDSYGSVFELLNSRSFAKILANEPERIDFCVGEYVKMLRTIHGITVPDGKLPDIKKKMLSKIERMKDLIPAPLGDKLFNMAQAIPDRPNMIHGDFHAKNIVLSGDEVLVIDMDTLSVGHPVFEFVPMYNAYLGYGEYDHSITRNFLGFEYETARAFWRKTLSAYLSTNDENVINEVEKKIRCLSYAYLIDWKTRHPGSDPAEDKATIECWKEKLVKLLPEVDELCFEAAVPDDGESNELIVEADDGNLQKVVGFVNSRLEKIDCPPKSQMQMEVAVEEIFVNIAHYAYAPNKGKATVRVDVSDDPVTVTITFIDRGIPYDPLKKEDPDVKLSAEERGIGGLGIFLTKKMMDDVSYEYKDGQNILTITKSIK